MSNQKICSDHLNIDQKHDLCRKAYEVCRRWWVDEFPQNESRRQKLNIDNIEEAFLFFNDYSWFNIYERTGPDPSNDWEWNPYIEISWSNFPNKKGGEKDIILWIELSIEDFSKIYGNYNTTNRSTS